jgi:hypothetical protein
MSTIIFIRNFQLYVLDVANKTDNIINHKYMDKNFVVINRQYAVDDNHNIYEIIKTTDPLTFDLTIIVDGANISSFKLLCNHIFYSDTSTSGTAYIIIFSGIIKLNSINYSDVVNINHFFTSIYEQYILVSIIIGDKFYVEFNNIDGQYIATYNQNKIQDFGFSNKYLYVIKNNIVYRQLLTKFVTDLGFKSSKKFSKNLLKFYEFDTNNNNVIMLYNDTICNTNYISNYGYPIICIQNYVNVIFYEAITGNLYHSRVNDNEKYVDIKLIMSRAKKYYNDNTNVIINNDDKLDVYTIGNECGFTKIFSVEGKFYYEANRVKSPLSLLNKQ